MLWGGSYVLVLTTKNTISNSALKHEKVMVFWG